MMTILSKKIFLTGLLSLFMLSLDVPVIAANQPQVSEAELLSGLDKDGRELYRSLDKDTQEFARELAAHTKKGSNSNLGNRAIPSFSYKMAVETAAKRKKNETAQNERIRLHNGLDRISPKVKREVIQ